MSQLIELTATYKTELHRFANADGDTIIAEVFANSDINDYIKVKGQADFDELQPEQSYRFYGRWTEYKNKRTGQVEKQFAFQSFVRQQPHSRTGIINYLRHAGEGLGFGGARAAKCWELFGSDAVKQLREQPGEVAAMLSRFSHLRFTAEQAEKVAQVLSEDSALEGCTLDLMDLLTGRGFPKSTSRLAVRLWGNRAAQTIRRNPYLLMKRFPGCGFKKCDALYLDLKHPPGRLKRQALCGWYEVATNTSQHGHTWWPVKTATDGIKANVAAADLQPGRAVELAVRSGWLNEIWTNGTNGPVATEAGPSTIRWIAEGAKAKNEADLAREVADAMKEPNTWPDAASVEGIDDHQRGELAKSLQGQIAVLGGSPGTGKTYVAAALIRSLVGIFGSDAIGVGAPTGKAAVRVTEALSGYGLPLRARTWHSMLALCDREGGEHFRFKVLIGDESSMVDTDLMAMVMRRRAVGTLFLIVGDVQQLPPVGHGAPLRDLIAAGLPYGELREIKRNSGGIVEACAAIRDGKRWEPGDNLSLASTFDPQQQIEEMLRRLRAARADGFDPIWDCQVVVPVNKKSALSRKELNKVLQAELNPRAGIAGSPFRLGDKIVNTKNAYFPSIDADYADDDTQTNERGEVYVANGELAEVIEVQEKMVVAKLSNPDRTIKIPRGKAEEAGSDEDRPSEGGENESTATGCAWDLGYCISVHKSQGSEWPVVVVMIDDYPGAKFVCSREWIYTAISRAKKQCVLIGKRETADGFCRRTAIDKRKTFLKERILIERASLELAEL